MEEKKYPKVSVITTVYNCESTLENTIKSVINQTYENIEYVVIDGNSTDGTLNIIKKYKDRVDYTKSESDSGIYDGMNKGIKNSSGDILFFLNANDSFYDDKVVQDVAKYFAESKDLKFLSGIVMVDDRERGIKYRTTKKKANTVIKKAANLHHQGVFIAREILEKNNNFDTKYRLAADFDFFCKTIRQGYKIKYIDRLITLFEFGGAGSNKKKSLRETCNIVNRHFGTAQVVPFYIKKLTVNVLRFIGQKLGLFGLYQKFKSLYRNKKT